MAITTFEIDVNTGDSIKSLSDLRNEFKDIQKQLSGLTPGTEEYINALKRLGQVKDDIGDLKDEINAFAGADKKIAAVTNVIGGLAGGFQAAQGAAALFGADNKALNETMVKLQATMAITQGIQGLAGMGDSLKAVGNLLKSTAIGTKIATAAQYLYNAAMAANPIGLIIAAVAALTAGIYLLVKSQESAIEAEKKLIAEREAEINQLERLKNSIEGVQDFQTQLAKASGKSINEIRELEDKQYRERLDNLIELRKKTQLNIDTIASARLKADEDESKELKEKQDDLIKKEEGYYQEILKLQRGRAVRDQQRITDDEKAEEERQKAANEKAKERAKKKEEDDAAEREYWRKRKLEEQAAEQFFSDELAEEEKNKKIFREKALQDELELIAKQNDEFNYKLYQEQKKRDEELIINKKKAKEQEVQLTLQGLTAIQGLADAFAGKSTESQKRAFQIKKAASLAQATIETYQAAQSAYASQMTIPTPDAPIRANIAAAIAIASGLARVAVIAKTKFEGGGAGATGGGGGGNLGTFSQGAVGQPPQGLTAQNTVTQLNPDGSVAGQGQRNAPPMKAYVVESESRAVTERVNKLSNNSKIG